MVVARHFMIRIISLATVSILWLGCLSNLPTMFTKAYLMVLDDCWISWMNLSSSMVNGDRLFMELMHVSKASYILIWRWTFIVAIFFAVKFFISSFSLLFASTCLHCANSTSVRKIYRSRIRIPPNGGVLIFQYYLLLLKYHHKLSLNILKMEDSSLLHRVIRYRPENIIFGWLSGTTILL